MVRYPHSVTVTWKGEPVKNESTGEYTAGATITHTAQCSIAQNSKGMKVGTTGGQMVDYSYSASMELQSWVAPFGASAVLTLEDGTVISSTVKRMLNRQTHSKIWL